MASAPQSAVSTPLPPGNQLNILPSSATSQVHASLPLPSTFDTLPILHELLSRLLSSESVNNLNTTNSSPSLASRMYPNEQPLPVLQLAVEASKIRNRIRRARMAVEVLPDMDRDLEEQEEEIEELRQRIKMQKTVLNGLGRTG